MLIRCLEGVLYIKNRIGGNKKMGKDNTEKQLKETKKETDGITEIVEKIKRKCKEINKEIELKNEDN